MTAEPLILSEQHKKMLLVESGLTEETVAQRGYRTVGGPEGAEVLAALGFNHAQAKTATRADVLLVPLFDITGHTIGHQIRPDAPRVSKGSPLKYETPAGAGNRVDIPPVGRAQVAGGVSPLWVTEGAKTADALAQAGAGTLMLAGVWGFMGRSATGIGTSVVSDLYTLAVEGRTVFLAYDSDVVTKEGVQAAERRLAEVLSARGAQVLVVRIPAGPGGTKQGADDFLAAGGTLDDLVATAAVPTTTSDPLGGKPPQVFAYNLTREGHEVAVDATGSFLLRPLDTEGQPMGPARRYSRDELIARTLSTAGARGATTLPQPAVAHAVTRLFGDHVDNRVPLAPAHVTRAEGATWVDMGTTVGYDVVRICADGWGYARWSQVPLWVLRDETARVLEPAAPAAARTWEPLRSLIGLDDEAFAVVRTWLVSLLVADRVPLLWWRGEPGSGKSTRADLIARVLGLPKLVPAPRDRQDAMSKLLTSPWLVAENLGRLEPSVSDMWCAAITDGALSDRVLYTSRQARVEGRWTGQVTSITDVPGALDDLMSRSLIIDVPVDGRRRPAESLHAEMDRHVAAVRGALFDDAVAVLRLLVTDKGPGSSYRFPALVACARALDTLSGTGGLHVAALEDAGTAAVAERSESDPWARWVADETRKRGGYWKATSTEILDAQRSARRMVAVGDPHDADLWPGSAKQVGWWLPSRAGRLRELGVAWRKLRHGTKGARMHVLQGPHDLGKPTDVSPTDNPDPQGNVSETSAENSRSEGCADGSDVSDVFFSGLHEEETPNTHSPHNTLAPYIESPGAKKTLKTAETSARPSDLQFSADVPTDVSRTYCQIRQRPPLPCSLDEARFGLVETIRTTGALTVDVETTGYPVGHPDYALRTVQLGGADTAWVFDVRDGDGADGVRGLVRDLIAVAPRLHAHSATADLVPLVAAGLTDESAWGRMYDTVIPAKLADPQSTGSDPGLKQLARAVLGDGAASPAADEERAALFKRSKWLTNTKPTTPIARSGWAQVDPADPVMLRYAASDVLDTAALANRLPQPPVEVVDRERAVQRITARVTHRGLRVDHAQVAALEAEHQPAAAAAAERVKQLGVDNPGSDRQLAERLTELGVTLPRTKPSTKFPDGQPSVAAGVLESLRGTSERAAELIVTVLGYRRHETVLSTFLEPYRVLCERGDGRARPTVYTLGTDTGRMSCVRPNLQQLPRQGGVRACITADQGQVLVSADFAGVEIRVMAALSQDPSLIRILAEGADLHAMVAEQAFGPGFTKADRYTAKRGVFGWAYGGGVPSLALQVGVPEPAMQAIVDSLQLVAPAYVQWADEVKRQVRAGATQMPTYAGRVIHLPREYPHKAPNYCIQGTARELLVDALLAWDQTRWGGGVVLPVHDEIMVVVPEQDAAEATAELVRCMETDLYGVRITADPAVPAFAWADSV